MQGQHVSAYPVVSKGHITLQGVWELPQLSAATRIAFHSNDPASVSQMSQIPEGAHSLAFTARKQSSQKHSPRYLPGSYLRPWAVFGELGFSI
eukprot:1158259-Pelagomonas_calceolata.AAC.5